MMGNVGRVVSLHARRLLPLLFGFDENEMTRHINRCRMDVDASLSCCCLIPTIGPQQPPGPHGLMMEACCCCCRQSFSFLLFFFFVCEERPHAGIVSVRECISLDTGCVTCPSSAEWKRTPWLPLNFWKGLDAGESAVGERIDVVYRRIVIYSVCVCVCVGDTHALL